MRSQRPPRSKLTWAWIAVFLLWPGASERALAQNFGLGASPGRGAYRPEGLWNGPFYSAPHANPWSPGGISSNDLNSSPATLPPYGNAPRGVYSAYSSGGGATLPYQEGFSPFSGYADWYVKAHGIKPTAEDIARATRQYFRSSPIPPNPKYLAPSVNAALAEVANASQSRLTPQKARSTPARPQVLRPSQNGPARPPGKVVIRRGVNPSSR